MRLGEIKKIIDSVSDEDHEIVIEYESVFGGQAYQINNFYSLKRALELLDAMSWNNIDSTGLFEIFEKKNTTVSSQDYSILSNYTESINRKLPFYYSIIEELYEEQEENAINIKISDEDIENLKELSATSLRIEKILKTFNIDGQFEYQGIDKGSTWLVLIAIGTFSYKAFLAGLKISREVLEQKKLYWEGKKAELDYKASLEDSKKYSKEGLEKYIENRIKLEIDHKLREEVKSLKIKSSKSEEELISQLTTGVKLLLDEVTKHKTEFHLSLNPPKYIKESNEKITINYSLIPEPKKENTNLLSTGE